MFIFLSELRSIRRRLANLETERKYLQDQIYSLHGDIRRPPTVSVPVVDCAGEYATDGYSAMDVQLYAVIEALTPPNRELVYCRGDQKLKLRVKKQEKKS